MITMMCRDMLLCIVQMTVFIPLDARFPYALMHRRDWPAEFTSNPSRIYNDNERQPLYIAQYKTWEAHQIKPSVKMKQHLGLSGKAYGYRHVHGTRMIGRMICCMSHVSLFHGSCRMSHISCLVSHVSCVGTIESETEALLTQYDVDYSHTGDFSDEILREIRRYGDVDAAAAGTGWQIPPSEISARRDIRDWRIFSIDPTTARDLDDALSITPLPDGSYEIGVHIADVSYFIPPESALDKEAQHRATSIYLVERVIPMLPRILCEQLWYVAALVAKGSMRADM